MKLIQLNAWGGRLDYQISSFFKNQAADLICLQEVISIKGEVGFFVPLEEIQTAAGVHYMVFGPAFSINFMRRVAGFGNAVLSRLPIVESEIIFTNQKYHHDFDFVEHGSSNMRNFVHTVINIGGKPCNILTHHGYWVREHKNGNAETMRQMEQIGEFIGGLSGPIILTGDFNLASHSDSLEQINRRLENLSISHNLKTTRNYLTNKTEVCDYIFVNDQIKVNKFYASDKIVSDHKALILEFDI